MSCPVPSRIWTLSSQWYMTFLGSVLKSLGTLCERLEAKRVFTLPGLVERRACLSHERPECSLFLDFSSTVVGLPVWLDIVRTAKEFQLACARRQALNDAIDLIWFVAGGTNLSYNYIAI
ncbi:hypothetical protein E2C01_004989 [Portunus trituberculatus]|uniref:Uncharacterized protein n=1 Tax=Portunus trituberculatus TaxID=210409 RepID=A0A5B7CUF1_PORTR|nr:hypothetical protein [Portunus trituberculatus]